MLWRRSAPAQTLPAPGPVPDAHAIRQLLLQASWKRDRWVARRRVALRWVLWGVTRYLLPALVVVGAVVFVWLWVWPRWLAPTLAPVIAPAVTAAPARTPASTPTPATPPSPAPRTAPESPDERPALASEPTLQLRLQAELPAPGSSAPLTKSAQPSADRFSPPKLTSDNWLHSKEP